MTIQAMSSQELAIETISKEGLTNVTGGLSACRLGMTALGAVSGATVGATGAASQGSGTHLLAANLNGAVGIGNVVQDQEKRRHGRRILWVRS
jgi:hypothetical protein